MNFKFRLKRYKDEEGEYSEYEPASYETIDKIIRDNWPNENRQNELQVISITSDSGDHLLLEHFRKDVYDVYYLPFAKKYHFHKKSKIEIIYDALFLFFNDKLSDLEKSPNKSKEDDSFIRGDFFYINHDYRYTEERSNREKLWLLYGLPFGLFIAAIGLMLLFRTSIAASPIVLPIVLLAVFVGTYMWLPGLLLHSQYKNDIGEFVVRLTRGQDTIAVKLGDKKKTLLKSDITSVTKYFNNASRNPWSDYGFTEIRFASGEIINLSNLLVDQLFVLDKFQFDNIQVKNTHKLIPTIRSKTIINFD